MPSVSSQGGIPFQLFKGMKFRILLGWQFHLNQGDVCSKTLVNYFFWEEGNTRCFPDELQDTAGNKSAFH